MRHGLAIVVAALLLTSCGSSHVNSTEPAPQGAAAACGIATARTLAASSEARVFVAGHTVYGCSPHGSVNYKLGQQGTSCLAGGRIQALAVAGELAAYGLERCAVDTGRATVIVRRLTDGKSLASSTAITNAVAVESFQSVDSIVLKSDGAVAWIAVLGSVIGHRHATEVHKLDKHGNLLLDSGPSIARGPLTLVGSELSWKHGSGSRSAMLQ